MLQQEYITIPDQVQEPNAILDAPASVPSSRQSGAHDMADLKVKEAADRVRQNLVQEIVAFNAASEAMGASDAQGFEDEAQNSKFSVTNPIKMSDNAGLKIGSVIKYTVTG